MQPHCPLKIYAFMISLQKKDFIPELLYLIWPDWDIKFFYGLRLYFGRKHKNIWPKISSQFILISSWTALFTGLESIFVACLQPVGGGVRAASVPPRPCWPAFFWKTSWPGSALKVRNEAAACFLVNWLSWHSRRVMKPARRDGRRYRK